MRKERKHFTPEEKVAILRRHVVDKVPVSERCEELGLRPTVFYRWQKELFESGPSLFSLRNVPTAKCPRTRSVSASPPCRTPDSTVCGPIQLSPATQRHRLCDAKRYARGATGGNPCRARP